jgi:AraC-like DNA-binding protein
MKRFAGTGEPAAKSQHLEEHAPTPVSRVEIEYIAPSRSLRPFVTTFFHFSCDDEEIHDIQPADVGKLMLVLKGEGTAHFRDGRSQSIPCCSLQSPTSVALPFQFTGGFHSCGAALTPLGWAALSGMPADKFGNQIFDAAEILGPAANQLCETMIDLNARPEFNKEAMQGALTSFVEKHLGRVNARHARLIEVTVEWLGTSLDPDLEALYAQSGYSRRQTQRLVERYFGLNPQALRRKYRAVRAAAILSALETDDEQVEAVMEHFYDQSHLIREIGIFVGRTPSRLGGEDKPILNGLLELRNFRIRS